MKKYTSYFLVLFLIITINEINAQFISVKDGNWNDPLTWSADPNATAIPDSNSNVTISHYVIASSGTYVDAECLNLTISTGGVLDNYGSAVVSGSIRIKNDLINNGTISPSHDFWLEIGGDFYNNGTTKSHYISQYQRLYIMGDIINNGSFHFTHTSFSDMDWNPNKAEHSHHIRSLNDSTLYLGETRFLDDLGSLIVDSLAIVSGQINLAGSKLILPSSNPYPNNLVLVNAQILSGKIEVNNNIISTQSGSIGYLGNYLGGAKNTIISNANLIGTFVSGGDPTDNGGENLVIFEGETTFEGNLVDWYSGSIWYNGDRGIFIDGTFTNNGNIYDATTDNGLFLNQKDNSTFISNGKLNNKAIIFSGTCNFSVSDSISTTQFKATDSNTVVNITKGDLIFKDRTVTVDFNTGLLNLASNSLFYTTYQWYNLLKNINVNANNSEIAFAHVGENTTINNAKIRYLTCDESTVLSGGTIVIDNGNLLSYSGSDSISILGDIENYGNIINSQSGTLYLSITGNVLHNGNQWSNIETKLNGIDDQNILIPNDSSWTGKVVLDAMLTGTNFQWQKDGVDIPDANSQLFNFNNGLNSSNNGVYQCLVDGNPSRKIYIGKEEPSAFEITDIIITILNDTQTKVTWKTTVPATGFIFYAENDATNGYPYEVIEESGLVLEHTLILDTLNFGSTYYFIIDQNDEGWVNNIRSEEFMFIAGDLPPAKPTGLLSYVPYSGLDAQLKWDKNKESDISFYTVYKYGEFLATTIDTTYIDDEVLDGNIQYKITATDLAGQESDFSDEINVLVGIEKENSIPVEYSLSQNYPNPFNPSTVIEFALPTNGNVKLSIFNSLGQEVAVLINEEMLAGNYNYQFTSANYQLSSGIYFYRITAGSFIKTNKMILVK
ncbi:MAG: T9SS type A sorting domain-containing protein [Bacteroidetes bacterium]|nr:T9SS type A sorting domain-containing protein [Bacteroidota bacterium]MBU1115770.1 T9SS type A sorting domain-containing protein [Bacteroidota bacterium]MBU1799442.1 T9SS type A sorting domain-containing protein [Bacteroidota bacterium]